MMRYNTHEVSLGTLKTKLTSAELEANPDELELSFDNTDGFYPSTSDVILLSAEGDTFFAVVYDADEHNLFVELR
jgi:hypothetical protein